MGMGFIMSKGNNDDLFIRVRTSYCSKRYHWSFTDGKKGRLEDHRFREETVHSSGIPLSPSRFPLRLWTSNFRVDSVRDRIGTGEQAPLACQRYTRSRSDLR